METIKFEKNWNGKLNCKAFFTIRLKNDEKYKVNQIYKIDEQGSNYDRIGVIRDITDFPIRRLNNQMSLLDMGVSPDLGIEILKEYYPSVSDWENEEFSLITIEIIAEMY